MSSASSTWQRPIYTQQSLCRVLHSAKGARKTVYRQRPLCRVYFIGDSAKPLPSVTLGKARTVNSLSTKTSLPSALYRALGNGFAECQSDTRQRKVAVTASATVTAALPSVKVKHSAKVPALPSAVDLDTRQMWPLCRVPPTRHSAKTGDLCRVPGPWHSANL